MPKAKTKKSTTVAGTIMKGYKYRIYPTKAQQLDLELAFAANNYVWDSTLLLLDRYYRRRIKPLKDKMRRKQKSLDRIIVVPELDANGNPVLDDKGKPKTHTLTDAEVNKLPAHQQSLVTRLRAEIQALDAQIQSRYLRPTKLKYVRRLRPNARDLAGDPWLGYVTTMPDGSPLPDYIEPRKLNPSSPFSGKPDPNGTRFLCVSGVSLSETFRTFCSTRDKAAQGKCGRPKLKVDSYERRKVVKRIRAREGYDGHYVTDREIYQDAARFGSQSIALRTTDRNVKTTTAPAPLDQVIVSRGRNARLAIPGVRGTLKCRLHREPEGVCSKATVSRDADGKWYVSLTCKNIPRKKAAKAAHKETAAEIGIERYLVLSHGHDIAHPSKQHDLQDLIEKETAKLHAKQGGHPIYVLDENGNRIYRDKRLKNGHVINAPVKTYPAQSKAYERQRRKVAALKAEQARIRRHNIHVTTHDLASDYGKICIRDNDVSGMLEKAKADKCPIPREFEQKLHHAIADTSFFEFRRQMEYKCDWLDRELVVAPEDTPTTQVCSECGYKNPDLAGIEGLQVRQWDCPSCGTHHVRDDNSAKNLYHWMRGTFYVADDDLVVQD